MQHMRALTRAELWHLRLGHAHPSKISNLSRNCKGIDSPIPNTRHPCHTCMDANICWNNRPPAAIDAPAGTWNLNLVDMGNATSMAGFRYISIFTIVQTRYVMIILHKTKSECPDILERVFTNFTLAGKTPLVLCTDGAGEYNTEKCNSLLLQHKVQKETSNSKEQFQNGMAKTMVNSLGKGICIALLSSNLPPEFWGFAAVNYIDVYNHLPHASLNDTTPWEMDPRRLLVSPIWLQGQRT
jgi:hypothetical protein